MLGRWKNYDELEESLCFDELLATINAMREKEMRERRFMAALQGVDLDESMEESDGESGDDITSLSGFQASQAGFGIGLGLGHMEVGE